MTTSIDNKMPNSLKINVDYRKIVCYKVTSSHNYDVRNILKMLDKFYYLNFLS